MLPFPACQPACFLAAWLAVSYYMLLPHFPAAAVPILASLSRDEKLTLLDAFEEKSFRPGDTVVRQVRGADNAAACLLCRLLWRFKGACCASTVHARGIFAFRVCAFSNCACGLAAG